MNENERRLDDVRSIDAVSDIDHIDVSGSPINVSMGQESLPHVNKKHETRTNDLNGNLNEELHHEELHHGVSSSMKEDAIFSSKKEKRRNVSGIVLVGASVLLSAVVGFGGGYYGYQMNSGSSQPVLYQAPITTVVSSDSSSGNLSIIDVASLRSSSVVEISTETTVLGSFMQQAISQGAGSGVVITSDGYIVTNDHVVSGATKISVRLKDGTAYEATLVGSDARTDIALLKVNAKGLQAAIFGDSSLLQVGEAVIAIGNPLGQLGGTVTDGIVSALDREITIGNESMRLLQTNAAINPGNSGGGLFNMRGELIGIVNAKSSGTDIEGLGFAIPSNDSKAVIEDLMEFGYVKGRVQLGVSLISLTSLPAAQRYGVSELGVYVQEVSPDSAALAAGVLSGDRIVSFHGKDITSYSDLKSVLDLLSVGQTVSMVVSRNGQNVSLSITLKEYVPVVSDAKQG